MKKCRICKTQFVPRFRMQPVCENYECKVAFALQVAEKAARKREKMRRVADKAKRDQLKTLRDWKADLKRVMHLWVRLRDEGKPCISCDTILIRTGRTGGDYDAGHCRSVGSAKHLQFDERNIHGQCKHCNSVRGLAGNYHEYRKRLPDRIGQEAFNALMCDQEPRHLTISDCIERITHYKKLTKQLMLERRGLMNRSTSAESLDQQATVAIDE